MEKLKGKLIWLSYNSGTEAAPVWEKFACSTSDGFSGSTETIGVATKCDDGATDNDPDSTSWEFTSSAVAVKDDALEAGLATYKTAAQLWRDRTVAEFKMSNADESYYRMGKGFISSYDETAETSGYLEFNLTITGKQSVALEAPVVV